MSAATADVSNVCFDYSNRIENIVIRFERHATLSACDFSTIDLTREISFSSIEGSDRESVPNCMRIEG